MGGRVGEEGWRGETDGRREGWKGRVESGDRWQDGWVEREGGEWRQMAGGKGEEGKEGRLVRLEERGER